MKFTGDIRRDFDKVTLENTQLKDRILGYQEQLHDLRCSQNAAQKACERQKAAYEDQLAGKDAIIKELKNRLKHELALKGHDGTNTEIPTSWTPAGKKKVIPNSRRSTGKKKDGQTGHERHMMGCRLLMRSMRSWCMNCRKMNAVPSAAGRTIFLQGSVG